jgi:hypothetical protein
MHSLPRFCQHDSCLLDAGLNPSHSGEVFPTLDVQHGIIGHADLVKFQGLAA